jgi:hypothetical protein
MTGEERRQIKARLVEAGFWGEDEPGDPTINVGQSLEVLVRAERAYGVGILLSPGVSGNAREISLQTGGRASVFCNGAELPLESWGDTFAESACSAALALRAFLKQHPECVPGKGRDR